MNHQEKQFSAPLERLLNPQRLELLDVPGVVGQVLSDGTVQSILDVGVGPGVFTGAFLEGGIVTAGVDVRLDMVQACKNRFPAMMNLVGRAEALPLADDSFDLVFLGHVLHETDHPVSMLSEARRIARQRVVILEWPDKDEDTGPPRHHRLGLETLRASLRASGLSRNRILPHAHMTLIEAFVS